MSTSKFIFRSLINHSADKVMSWHLRPSMEMRATPPWAKVEIQPLGGGPDREGAQFKVHAKFWGPIWKTYLMQYCHFVPNEAFEITQIEGPFIRWQYQMKLRAQSEHSCEIIDQYQLSHRFPKVVSYFLNHQLQKRYSRLLKYKHDILQNDIDLFQKYQYEKPLKVLVTGARGFVGSSLVCFLEFMGHEVWKLSRSPPKEGEKALMWDDLEQAEGFDAVIHLAGESIGKGLWTHKKKQAILDSRTKGTEKLASLLLRLKHPPKTLIAASAVGFYGDRGSEILSEESSPGTKQFVSEVCQRWERSAKELEEEGIRVVRARFGVVLSPKGGALKQMLLPFQLGLGGKMGHGHQYMSWIAMDDLVAALYHILMTPSVEGAVNCTSPQPVMNQCFTKELSKALNRWPGPPLPAWTVRLLFGQKGEELLLSSARVLPKKLLESGYNFQFPNIRQAFEHLL